MVLHVLQERPFLTGETFPERSGSGEQEEKLPLLSFIGQPLPLSPPWGMHSPTEMLTGALVLSDK